MTDVKLRAGPVSPVGVIRGSGTSIVHADDAFLHTVGYTREDFASGGMDWAKMTPPEFLHLDEAGIQQALTSGSGFTAPYRKEFIRKDGSRVPVLLLCAFVPETVGTWIGYVVDLSAPAPRHAVANDAQTALTERLPEDFYARLVAELVRERARMLTMLDNTDALVWAVDPQARLLAGNAAFQSVQRMISGRDIAIGESLLGPQYEPRIVAHWMGLYARALAGERFSTRTELQHADGVIHFETLLSPIVDAREGGAGVAIVSQNVTARVGAERALRESEARFRHLANAAPLGIFLADATGASIYANPAVARIWDLTPEEILGSGWTRNLHPEDAERVQREWSEATAAQRELTIEFRIALPTGERHVRVWVAPVREGDRVTSYVGSVEDATERHAQAARARQREKMESLGTLAGGIAHDFNNMLTVILGYAEVALDDPRASDLESSLREIQVAGTRAQHLVRQILTFSRQTERAEELLDLGAVVVEGVRLLRATLPAGTPVDVSVPPSPIVVRGDATALQQIVVNLCTNAAHAMRDRVGAIRVLLEARGEAPTGEALLSVADRGTGMSPDVQQRLFEPFFTTKPVGEGTGMGLAVVHGIVTAHGGTISVETSPGNGATFRVSLPLVSGVAASASPIRPKMARGTGRVLVAEDEAAIASYAERALARAGYAVACVSNGMEALRMFSDAPDAFDLVVSDLAMPGLSGDKLAKAIHVVRPEQRVVLVSGYVGSLGSAAMNEMGVSAIIAKPFTQAQLLEVVAKALATES